MAQMPFFTFFFLLPISMLAFWSRSRTFGKPRTIKEEKKSSRTQGGEDKAGIYCVEINQCKLRISHLLKPITVKRSNPLANSSFVSSRLTYNRSINETQPKRRTEQKCMALTEFTPASSPGCPRAASPAGPTLAGTPLCPQVRPQRG